MRGKTPIKPVNTEEAILLSSQTQMTLTAVSSMVNMARGCSPTPV